MAHIAFVLVDDRLLARFQVNAHDLAERFCLKELPEARVGKGDARRILRLLFHQHGANIFAVRRGIGPPPGQHGRLRLPDEAFFEGIDVDFVQLVLPPGINGIVDRANASPRPAPPLEVGHLGDFAAIQVIAEEVALVLPVRGEDKRASLANPTRVGKIEVIRVTQVVGQLNNRAIAVAVAIGEAGILVDSSFAHGVSPSLKR